MSAADGITLKVKRARDHLELFNQEVHSYVKRNPIGIETKLHPQLARQPEYDLIILLRIKEEPPAQLSALAGAFCYELRSCLDHLAFALSSTHTANLSEKDAASIGFPIFKGKDLFSRKDAKDHPATSSGLYKMRLIQPEAQSIIEGLQPYHSGNSTVLHPLWMLHRLNIIDKHRQLITVGPPIGRLQTLGSQGKYEVTSTQEVATRPLRDRAIIAKSKIVPLPGWDGHVQTKGMVPAQVAFDGFSDAKQLYASEIMREILEFVGEHVVPPLSPFL